MVQPWGALFDLDGTLMDSERHSHAVITRALAARGLPDPGLPDNKVFGCRWLDIARDAVEAIAAAKGGLEGLVRAAAASYAPRRLRVNAVAMGLVNTPLAAKLISHEPSLKASEAMHPLGRIGQPEEVAEVLRRCAGRPGRRGSR